MDIPQNGAEVNQYASSVVSRDIELKKRSAAQTNQDATTVKKNMFPHTKDVLDIKKKKPH